MAFTLSRIDRKSRTYDLSATVLAEAAAIPPDLTGVDVALLPPRGAPTAATVWFSATYDDGSFTVLLAGPDADSTDALVVTGSADIWMRIADSPEVDAEKLERITVLGGGNTTALPTTYVTSVAGLSGPVTAEALADELGGFFAGGVTSVNGESGAVVLDATDVGAATAADITTASTADRARTNHTGTQSADTLTDGTTNKAFLATERTKLTGIATGATANATDAQLRDRSTHTGTQAASTVTGLATVATTGAYSDLSGKPTLDTWGLDLIATSDPMQAIAASGLGVANRVVHQRVMGSGAITKVGLVVTTAAGNIAVALYRSTGSGRSAVPGSLVVTTGSVACPAAGYAEISLGGSFTVQPGDWLAIGATDSAAQFRCVTGSLVAGDQFAGRAMYGDTHYPPATNPTGLTVGLSRGPLVIGVP